MHRLENLFQVLPFGDKGILLKAKSIDLLESNKQIAHLVSFLDKLNSPIIQEWIPAYNSITLIYDLRKINYQEFKNQLFLGYEKFEYQISQGMNISLPVCYDEEYALDMELIMQQTGLNSSEIIDLHLHTTYRVYMTGFTPGFIYLGELPEEIQVKRKAIPRKITPQGSVGLADKQTGIYSVNSPGGWQIIGRSINILDGILNNSLEIKMGDSVSFYEVNKQELNLLTMKVS